MQQTEKDRRDQVMQKAWYLAMSGEFMGWQEVEARLHALGFAAASRWLDDEVLRKRIDEICISARATKA